MKKSYAFILALGACSTLAACGGSSGGGGGSLPGVTHPVSTATPSQPQSDLQFVIKVPAPPGSSASVRRNFVSAATRSVRIDIQGGASLGTFDVSASSSLCKSASDGSRTCTLGVNAAAGNDVFVVTAFDQPSGSGNTLASGTVAQTVTSGQTANVDLSLMSGVTSRITLALGNANPPAGTAASVPVIVQAYDADGNVIVGTYDRTVSLSDADTSGHTHLSAASLNASSASVTLAYDGASFIGTSISATANGLASPAPVTFAVTPVVTNKFDVGRIWQPDHSYRTGAGATEIAQGKDGNFWVTGSTSGLIMRFTPSGVMTKYWLPKSDAFPQPILAGKDGALWFAETGENKIGRITTSGAITEYQIPTQDANPIGIAQGPDGNIWFTEQTPNKIGKIDANGTITEYPLGDETQPGDLAAGPDGNLWVDELGTPNAIAVVKTDGTIVATYPIPTANGTPYGMIEGPDKNMWFGEYTAAKIARITPGGQITEYATPSSGSGPVSFANGPDGRIWFAENGAQYAPAGQIGYIDPKTGAIREVYLNEALHARGVTFDTKGNLWYAGFYYDTSEVGEIVY